MTSPLSVTLQPVFWKKTLQPALHWTARNRRLFIRPGRLWAILVLGGSFWRRRSMVCVERMRLPLSWMMVIKFLLVAADFFVVVVTRDLEAAVSINAVLVKLVGLAQPGS